MQYLFDSWNVFGIETFPSQIKMKRHSKKNNLIYLAWRIWENFFEWQN